MKTTKRECYGCSRQVSGYLYRNLHRNVWSEQLRCERCDYALTNNVPSQTENNPYLITLICRKCGRRYQTSAQEYGPCPFCRPMKKGSISASL